jgi:biopolymer transport protein ExbB/TolQ
MLIYTEPSYWEPRPLFHAEKLRDFLSTLLDPQKPGVAFLGIPEKRKRTCNWLSDQGALEWIERTYRDVWHRGGQMLSQYGKAVSEPLFDTLFTEHKAEVFIDSERFLACLGQTLGPIRSEELRLFRKALEDAGRDFFLGFSIDWSYLDSIIWTPQLRISNFWPSSRRIAPEPFDWYHPPMPMSPKEAADVLENWFWKEVETLFRMLRRFFHLGQAVVWLGNREVEPPVFYYAEPTWLPENPDEFLTSPDCFSALETLCRVTLGTDDPTSADVAGAFLENNLLTLRREIVRENILRAFYLLIPWWHGSREEWVEEVEREAAFVADKWSFVEFSAGFKAYDIITDLEMPAELMALWGGTLDTAVKLVSRLHNMIAYEPTGSPRRQEVFALTARLRGILGRLKAEMLRVTDDVMATNRKMEAGLESGIRFAKQAFTSRPLPKVRHLLDALPEFFSYRYTEYTVHLTQAQVERTKQLRDTYDSIEASIRELISQQEREEKEREQRFREEQREREERRQRTLNYGLAALAAITAFPILIGQMDWTELQQVISRWPKPFTWLGTFLKSIHPYLVLIAVVAAGAVIFFLLGMLLYTASRVHPERRDISAETDEFSEVGSSIIKVWQSVDRARPLVNELRERAFISHRVPGIEEPEDVQRLRKQIDDGDRTACQQLVEVWEWLRQIDQALEAPPEDELEYLKLRVHRFIILTELFDNRPVPFPFPLALCLFRYKSTDFVTSTIVSDFEFEQILNGYGFDDDEVKAIDQWAEQPLKVIKGYEGHELAKQGKRVKDLPAREFIEVMRNFIGVSALHNRTVKSPRESG